MERKYSAGMVKRSFWFSEFRKVIQLLNSGKKMDEIKAMNIEENIFAAPTTARAIQIFNTVSTRVKSLDKSFYKLFEESDIATQKIIALIAVMNVDSLFFDFVYEVYREKLMIGSNQLKDSLESLQQSSSVKGYERMKTNFINTSLKVRTNHIAFLCENLDKTIKEVKHELLQIAPNDKETYITYKNKIYDLLNVWLKDETWSRQARPGGDSQ